MKDLLIVGVTAFVIMVVVGCAQGAGNTPSGSTGPTTSPGTSGEQLTTAERTSASLFVRMTVYAYGHTDVLECLQGATEGGGDQHMEKVRSEAGLVEHARRSFSKRIEEGDTVELVGSTEGTDRGELRKVRVVRGGRVVALFYYPEAYRGGGWALEYYEWCSEF
jgi:hypothetical protein